MGKEKILENRLGLRLKLSSNNGYNNYNLRNDLIYTNDSRRCMRRIPKSQKYSRST